MTKIWTNDELDQIAEAEELEIAPRRRDGSLANPVTIWVVRVGDNLYVRSWRGRNGVWFRGVLERHEGYIQAGGVAKDVIFVEETAPCLLDQIDDAYLSKYSSYGEDTVGPMVAPDAQAATIKLMPR